MKIKYFSLTKKNIQKICTIIKILSKKIFREKFVVKTSFAKLKQIFNKKKMRKYYKKFCTK